MASTITQIKQQVNQVGQQAKSTSAQLAQLAKNLERNIASVNNAIGGTANGEDKDMIAAFQMASQAVEKAAQALQAASKSATDWANKA